MDPPELFRFGASSLLGDIERQLEHFATGAYSASFRHAIGDQMDIKGYETMDYGTALKALKKQTRGWIRIIGFSVTLSTVNSFQEQITSKL